MSNSHHHEFWYRLCMVHNLWFSSWCFPLWNLASSQCFTSKNWNKWLSLFLFSKAFLTLFGWSMWRSCLHPIQVLRGGVAWWRVSSKIPFFVPAILTNQCHCHGTKKNGVGTWNHHFFAVHQLGASTPSLLWPYKKTSLQKVLGFEGLWRPNGW